MTSFLKNMTQKSQASADVVDGYLILSLPHAIDAVVWRMALDKIGTAVFEIKQDDKTEISKLILKPKKGTAEIIATFNTKEEAIDALMKASHALQSGSTKSPAEPAAEKTASPSNKISHTPQQNSAESKRWLIALFGALAVIGLYYYLTTLIPKQAIGFENNTSAVATSSPQNTVGVPVSADDFLSGF